MLARLDPRVLDRISFPLGEQSKEETRAEAERAGLAAARRPESQEACFLGGDDYRSFLARQGLQAEDGVVEDEGGQVARQPRRLLALHAGPAEGPRRRGRVAGLRAPHRSRPQRRRRRAARVAGPDDGFGRTAASSPTRTASASSSATARRRSRAACEARARGFDAVLDEPAYGVAAGQAAVLYDGDVVVGAGRVVSSGT